MAEFGNTLFEGAITPEVQRQAPVENNSGAVLAESLGGAFQTAGSIFGTLVKGNQEEEANRVLNEYRQEGARLANAVDQKAITLSAARTRMRAKYVEYVSNNPGLADEIDALHSKLFAERGIAGVVQDESPEEKARNKIIEDAMANGWVSADTPEAIEQGVSDMMAFRAAENRVNAVAQELRLVQSRNGIVTENQKFRAQQATLELANTGYPWAQAQIAKAQQLIMQGADPGETLTQVKNDINARLAQIQVLSEGSDIAWITKPFERLLESFEDSVTGKTTTAVYQAEVTRLKAIQEASMRADPELGPMIAISDLFGQSTPEVVAAMSQGAITRYLNNLRPPTDQEGNTTVKSSDLIGSDEDTKMALDRMKSDIGAVLKSGTPSEQAATEINNLVINTLRSFKEYAGSANGAADFIPIIQFFSDNSVGEWSSKMGGIIPSDLQQVANEAIRTQYEDVLLPLVRQGLEEVPYIVNFTPGGEMGAFGGISIGGQINREEAINMFWNGMGVEFRAADGYATNPAVRAKVEDLNRGPNAVAIPLNTLIRAQAHIAGHTDYQKVWEQLEPRIFPQMAQEGQEPSEQGVQPNTNLTSPEASVGQIDPLQVSSPQNLSLTDFNEEFSAKVIQDGEAANPRKMVSATSPIEAAKAYLGLREENAEEAKVLSAFFKEAAGVSLNPAKTAWCAAFVDAILRTTGGEGTGKLNARSYLNWGVPVDTPKVGDVVVFSRGDPNGWQGHVGFYMGTNPDGTIKVLGGNQSNSVSVSDYDAGRLLGYRRAS